MTKKMIEVEVQFVGGDFHVYTFHSELLASGFAKDVFKHGATFIRNNAYHTYSPSAVICTKVRTIENAGTPAKSTPPNRKAKKPSGGGSRPPADNRKADKKD